MLFFSFFALKMIYVSVRLRKLHFFNNLIFQLLHKMLSANEIAEFPDQQYLEEETIDI